MHTNIDKTQNPLVEKITENIKNRMEAINEQLVAIDLYDKDHSTAGLKEQYDSIYEAIKRFEEYIKSDAFEQVTQSDIEAIKKQVYERFFSSSAPPESIELLSYATLLDESQKTDYDLILACARRAKQNSDRRLFFMCNLDFIESELLNKEVKIGNVKNLGILHHYLPIKFGINQDQIPVFDPPLQNKHAEEIVTKVFEVIPRFIKENIESPNLKVVLRSCSGAAPKLDTREDHYPSLETLPATRSYPVKLLPPHTKINPNNIKQTPAYPPVPKSRQKVTEARDAAWYRENEFKRARETSETDKKEMNICIRQDVKGDEVETLLYLPFIEESISLKGFPELKTKEDFKLFAEMLIEFLGNYEDHPIHINHYSITPVIKDASYELPDKKIIGEGFRLFKQVVTDEVKEWESRVALESKESKTQLKRLFTAANDLHDVVPLHEKSYAAQLLSTIKDDCPNVSVFKAYFGGYRPTPDRTIREVSKTDINYPKAIVVSRHKFWKMEQPKKEQESPSEDATPSDNNKLSS